MVTDGDLAALSEALAGLKAAEDAFDRSVTLERVHEVINARREMERVNLAVLPGVLAEIKELRRLVRLHALEHVP
jgi:hypothetical protein